MKRLLKAIGIASALFAIPAAIVVGLVLTPVVTAAAICVAVFGLMVFGVYQDLE